MIPLIFCKWVMETDSNTSHDSMLQKVADVSDVIEGLW
jgi:hypothetical protein